MRVQKIASICLALLTAVALLAGCGSSQRPAAARTGGTAGTLSAQGVAVDPYIVGAIFQEVAADGTVLQRSRPRRTPTAASSFPTR